MPSYIAKTWLGVPSSDAPPSEALGLSAGLEDRGLLGVGGMGEVRLAHEAAFDRPVAVKVMSAAAAADEDLVGRFWAEGQHMASLDHPALVPVYARGTLDDGRPWYSMRRVRGTTLQEALTGEAQPLSARVEHVLRIAQVLAFAHEQGVVHRDVTPRNVLLGPFGEVLLLDWGLAMPSGEVAPRTMGTPGFAAPEQTVGGQVQTGAVDVYALGKVLARVMWADPAAPDELLEWVDAVTDPEPERRPTAAAVAEALQDWLLGARAQERALAIRARHQPLAEQAAQQRQEAQRLAAQADEALDRLGPYAPVEAKATSWAQQEQAVERQQQAENLEARWVGGLHAALEVAPGLPEVRADLATHHHRAARRAIDRGDRQGEAHHRRRLAAYDDGRFASFLARRRVLHLQVEPADARVEVRCFVERGRRLVPGPLVFEGPVPHGGLEVPAASLLLTLTAPGCEPLVLPVDARQEPLAPPPGRDGVLRLPRAGTVRPDEVWVQGGWFRAGGDPDAMQGLPGRTLWVDSFVMKRFPVRLDAYVGFLNALLDAGREQEALGRITDGYEGRQLSEECVKFTEGRFRPATVRNGVPIVADGAAFGATLLDARALARWLAVREGVAWRLPHELEVEKAMRGVDGRAFVWGDHFEGTWAATGISMLPARVPPLGTFPEDVSVYGVRDLAGGVRTWCANPRRLAAPPEGSVVDPLDLRGEGAQGCQRGGSFTSREPSCRAASRFPARAVRASAHVGIRLVRTPSDDVFLRG